MKREKSPLSHYEGVQLTLMSLASLPPLRDGLYLRPDTIQAAKGVEASGAVGPCNQNFEKSLAKGYCVQNQRVGADLIAAGTATQDAALIELGWRVLAWPFASKIAGTGLDYGRFPADADRFHSVSFYIEGLARAALISRGVGNSYYATHEREIHTLVRAGAEDLAFGKSNPPEEAQGGNWAHRDFVLGAVLTESGLLLDEDRWTEVAERFVRTGLSRQLADGAMPERNKAMGIYGYDVNYQAAGIIYASRYYVTSTNEELRMRVAKMIGAAAGRLTQSIDPTTLVISGAGSTRTCREYSNNGVFKRPEPKLVVEALSYAGAISSDKRFLTLAKQIVDKSGWGQGRNDVLLATCP